MALRTSSTAEENVNGLFLEGFTRQRSVFRFSLRPVLRFAMLPAFVRLLWASVCLAGAARAQAPPPSSGPVAAPAPPAAPAGKLNVTFWNLQWFPGHRPGAGAAAQQNHVLMVSPVLGRLRPDVLGLEEVGDAAAAHLLADRLPGFHVDVCTGFTREPTQEPSRQQIVLCSRLPLLTAGWQAFRADARGLLPRRGFAYAVYQTDPGEVLLVYGLHLKSNVNDEPGGDATNIAMREESVRQVLAHRQTLEAGCARWGKIRLEVIGGDMNTSLDDPRFQPERTLRDLGAAANGFLWAWQGVPAPLRLTLPGAGPYPSACFDHVFYRGDGVRLLGTNLEPTGRGVSDHRPVSARFDW